MNNQHKSHRLSRQLIHSAVYRHTSPSADKPFKLPSSKSPEIDQISHFKFNGSYFLPSFTKKSILRHTVDGDRCQSHSKTLVFQHNKIYENKDDFYSTKNTQKFQSKGMRFNQNQITYPDIQNNQKAYSLKSHFQTQEPLVNRIIKKIDEKQKLLSQLKKIAETQLPTRIKKKIKQLSTQANAFEEKALSNNFSLSVSFVTTQILEENSLKQKYLNRLVSENQNNSKIVLQKQKITLKKLIYFTPKTTKNCEIQNYSKSTKFAEFKTPKYQIPQKVKSSVFEMSNNMEKNTNRSFEATNSSIHPIQLNISAIHSEETLFIHKLSQLTMKLQDFQVIKSLGEGKFGTVMKVIHKKSNFLFAMKRVSKATIKSSLMVQQLTLQIRIQGFCNHKNIAKLYAVFDDSQYLYLLLEYMEEGTLFSYLKKKKTLQQVECATRVKQVAQAVKYLHQYGIAHRDIKPQNIVISNGVGKLCDFGWAAICNERRKTYCGTFDYAAPEILEGNEYDMSVDMWCLGVLAYELLVGKAPFYHLSRKQTMKKIMNVNSSNIQFPRNLSKTAVDFIKKLLIKQPEQRMNAQIVLKHPFLNKLITQ